MATEVIKIIDPDMGSGYDYDSLFDWEAAQQGDLTGVRDEIAVGQLRPSSGTADTTAFTIAGWTTDSTRFVKVTAAVGYEAIMPWTAGKATITSSVDGDILLITQDYTVIEKLQTDVQSTNGAVWAAGIGLVANYVTISHNIFRGPSSNTNSKVGVYVDPSTYLKLYRNVVYRFNRSNAGSTAGIIYDGDSVTNEIINNTVFDCSLTGISLLDEPVILKQNYVGSCSSTCYLGTSAATTSKNISSDATSPDGASYQDKNAYSDYFVDYANRDFHLKSTDTVLKDAGDNLGSPYNVDFDGGSVTGTWDIGADEYGVAVGSSIVPLLLYQYRARRQ